MLHLLRTATLSGIREQEITPLIFHLLAEFATAQQPVQAILNVSKRVTVQPELQPRLLGMCTAYISQFVCAGVLVPAVSAHEGSKDANSSASQKQLIVI